jgi:hypothetical protein
MKTIRTIVRVVFLVLVMLTYARNSYAGANWGVYCNSMCREDGWRINSCTFVDFWDDPLGVADESWCGWDPHDPGDVSQEGQAMAYWACVGMAGVQPPYATFSVSCTEEPTQGSFTCNYFDFECGS